MCPCLPPSSPLCPILHVQTCCQHATFKPNFRNRQQAITNNHFLAIMILVLIVHIENSKCLHNISTARCERLTVEKSYILLIRRGLISCEMVRPPFVVETNYLVPPILSVHAACAAREIVVVNNSQLLRVVCLISMHTLLFAHNKICNQHNVRPYRKRRSLSNVICIESAA